MLRDVSIEMPMGCDAATLQSASISSLYQNVRSLGCSDTYTSAERLQVGVCHANALCVASTVAAEQLTALRCTCDAPAYPNPDLAPAHAPYEVAGGCLVPRRMEQLTLTSDSVQRSLRKPEHMIEHVNLTIYMTGDDGAATTFNVTNAPSLPPWIQLARITEAIPASANTVQVPVILKAAGLGESVQAYAVDLSITVASKQVVRTALVRQIVSRIPFCCDMHAALPSWPIFVLIQFFDQHSVFTILMAHAECCVSRGEA